MLLNSKKLAFMGLMLAFDIILIVLSGTLEFNTLFLLAGASFCIGIAIRESNIRIGLGFYIASLLLGFLLAPNKLYCVTYAAFGLYLLIIEFTYDKLIIIGDIKKRKRLFWILKYTIFNCMFLPMLYLLPKLFYRGELSPVLIAGMLLGGQAILYIYDKAYLYFQTHIWGRFRGRLKL